MDNNYDRLNWSAERDLNDYQQNDNVLSASEIRSLIRDRKPLIIGAIQEGYPIYAGRYSFVPDWVLNQLYDQVIRFPRYGMIKMFLDDEVDGYHWGVELLVGILEAFNIRDYKASFLAGEDVIISPKPLSRTTGSQSIGDMSVSFESERLGIDISQPFEQFLSTIPNGIEIIDKHKQYLASMPCCGVV